jgi:hypothetical protein
MQSNKTKTGNYIDLIHLELILIEKAIENLIL